MKVGNPTLTPERHKMTSSIFPLYIIFATKFVSYSSLVHVYECLDDQGLGLARLGLHTRVRVIDLGLGLETGVRVTHKMTK